MKQIFILLTTFFFSHLTIHAQDTEQLDFDEFKSNLRKDMDNKTIVKTFGEPSTITGSGISIYIYNLSDSTTVMVGCTSKVLYANHYDKHGDLLHILVSDSNLNINPTSFEYTYLAVLRPDLNQKEAIINAQKIFTAKAGQLILYNDYAHTAWIDNGLFRYIPPEDLVKVDTFYFRFDFSKKEFQLDSKNDLFETTKKQGIDINKITNSIINMDSDALYDLFLLKDSFDGASAEIFPHHFWSLLMTWNDKSVADFITNLKVKDRKQFVDYIINSYVTISNRETIDLLRVILSKDF